MRLQRHRYLRKPFLAICLVILTACTATRGAEVSELGTGGCALPCWRGIRPGETTQDIATETLLALQESGEGEFVSYQEHPYLLWADDDRYSVLIDLHQGIVTRITIPIEVGTVDRVLSAYGQPDAYFVFLATDTLGGDVHLYYPDHGAVFVARADPRGGPPTETLSLQSNSPVVRVILVPITRLTETVARAIGDPGSAEEIAHELRQWQGYGVVYP